MSLITEKRINIEGKIGAGGFGEVYLGIVERTGQKVAIKFEKQGCGHPQLRHEYKVYKALKSCFGFNAPYFYGDSNEWKWMGMELQGPSLAHMVKKCGGTLQLVTVLQLADQLLDRINTLHQHHIIHRDLKPENFLVGLHYPSTIFLVDFGLSTYYRHPKMLIHRAAKEDQNFEGTPRFASINSHCGMRVSRRDDLEAVAHMLVYFLRGRLPWQGLHNTVVGGVKKRTTIAEVCRGCPPLFAEFLHYCRTLGYDEDPDIPLWRDKFQRLLRKQQPHEQVSSEDAQPPSPTTHSRWEWDNLLPEISSNAPHSQPSIKQQQQQLKQQRDDDQCQLPAAESPRRGDNYCSPSPDGTARSAGLEEIERSDEAAVASTAVTAAMSTSPSVPSASIAAPVPVDCGGARAWVVDAQWRCPSTPPVLYCLPLDDIHVQFF